MAQLSVTAADVVPGDNAVTRQVTAGATITAGQVVYRDTSDNEYKLADADVQASTVAAGIALNGASDGQPMTIQTEGDINPGGTVRVGEVYIVSPTAGGIGESGTSGGTLDISSGDFVTILGVGTATNNIALKINVSGAAKV